MSDKFYQAFKNISQKEPNDNLEGLILSKINRLEKRKAAWKLALSCFGFLFSLLTMGYGIMNFGSRIWNSDFWEMASLAFSDSMIVFSHWNYYFPSLVETFPAVSLAVILLPVFASLVFLNFLLKARNYPNRFNTNLFSM